MKIPLHKHKLVYLLADKERMIAFTKTVEEAIVPDKWRIKLDHFLQNCDRIFSRYIRTNFLDALIVGIASLLFLLIFNMPYAALISVIAAICNMIPTEKYGIYHVCNSGWMSWAHFAELIMAEEMLRCKVTPVPTSEYPTPAHRPLNSRMSTRKLNEAGFGPMPGVEDALHRYLQELAAEQREG